MADTNIAFANIVPNTSPASWSQAYNAGKLFAVLSLQQEPKENLDESLLNVLGKEVISTFEQEFFTLENKDLDSIKNAISQAIQKITHLPSYSFVITYISGSVLYVFILGGGSVILKRGSKIGTILEADQIGSEIKSASGFLQNDDLIVLQTKDFSKVINMQTLAGALDQNDPGKIAEELAPKIHEKQDGSSACVILFYKDEKVVETLSAIADLPKKEDGEIKRDNFEEISLNNLEEEKPPKPEETSSEPPLSQLVLDEEDENQSFTASHPTRRFPKISLPSFSLAPLNHRKRVLLTVAGVIVVVLAASVFLGIRNKNDNSVKQAFAAVYPKALEKYNEGRGLVDLNKNFAHDDFLQAQKLLNDNKNKFSKGSSEARQIDSLLVKINQELGEGAPSVKESEVKTVPSNTSDLLSVELNNSSVDYFTQDGQNTYFIDGAGGQRVNKNTNNKVQLISKSWGEAAGIGVFGANIYILDKANTQIWKFSPPASGSAYLKSSYLGSSTNPDFSKTVSMTIDGAVYVLGKDGKIQKFLRGSTSPFSITGLDKPMSNPTRIVTDADTDNIYILDNGNSRIVVLNKTGGFVAQYVVSAILGAKDFDVLEKDKKVYVLSGGKIYQINLK